MRFLELPPPPPNPKNGTLAPLARAQAAWLLAISPKTLDDAIRPRLGMGEITGSGKNLRFDPRAVVAAYVAHRLAQQKPAEVVTDPLMTGPEGSPALERYRASRADISEMERDRLRGVLIPRHELDTALASLATQLRTGLQALQREFGNGPTDLLNEILDEWEQSLVQMFPEAAQPAAEPQPAEVPA